jgi:uncharacterized protein YndB with AHSA1/START domain
MKNNLKAPVSVLAEATIRAPAELVWATLTRLDKWPEWHHGVSRIRVDGGVEVGTRFDWTSGFFRIESQLVDVDFPEQFAWSGRTFGMHALRVWRLQSMEDRTQVVATESLTGLLPSAFPQLATRMLTHVVTESLLSLKAAAEAAAVSRDNKLQ